MNKRNNAFKTFLLGIMMVSLLGGCALYNRFFGEGEEEKKPAELMREGMHHMEVGRYEDAIQAFQNVKDRYPYSQYALTAELRMADAMFEREDYDQAYDAYAEFEKLHPKNENIPYVIYRQGMSNFLQIKTVDREQIHTSKARETFERLVRRFPRSEYAAKAQKNIRKTIIYLAEYELYVARYYFKKGYYRAALARYNYLIKNYPDMGQYHEAIEYIAKCKEKLALEDGEG